MLCHNWSVNRSLRLARRNEQGPAYTAGAFDLSMRIAGRERLSFPLPFPLSHPVHKADLVKIGIAGRQTRLDPGA